MMNGTHTSFRMDREEMLNLLTMLNVTTSLVRLADERDDHKGVCGAFEVRRTPLEQLYVLEIKIRYGQDD